MNNQNINADRKAIVYASQAATNADAMAQQIERGDNVKLIL
jgi:hypothetical protein